MHFIVHHTSCNQTQIPKWPWESQPSLQQRKKTLVQTHNALIAPLKNNVKGWEQRATGCMECGGWRWQYYHHLDARSSEKRFPQKVKVGSETCPGLAKAASDFYRYGKTRAIRLISQESSETWRSFEGYWHSCGLPTVCLSWIFWEQMFRGVSYFYAH